MPNDLTQFESVLFVLSIPFFIGLAFGLGMLIVGWVFWMITRIFTRGTK